MLVLILRVHYVLSFLVMCLNVDWCLYLKFSMHSFVFEGFQNPERE